MNAARFILLYSLLYFFSAHTVSAQVDLAEIDRYIAQAQKDWNIPGLSVAIVKDGKIVHEKGYGQLKSGSAQPADEHSLYAIASNSKAFTATAIAMLVEQGELNWNDPVTKYIPDFALYDPYVSRAVTVRDLLCHRVGLGTFSGDVIWYKTIYPADEVVRRIRYVPKAYDFRAGYGYSNLMFITAGEVIRAVSGLSWAEFMHRHILDPLGMDRTQTSVVPLADMENIATPHKPNGQDNQPIDWANWDNMGAAGGLISSVHDMASWMILQLNGGNLNGHTLISNGTQRDMWHPYNSIKVSARYKEIYPMTNFRGYGMGWSLSDYGGHKVVAHGGGYDGMYSRVQMVPEAGLGVVVLTNSMKGISSHLCNYIVDRYLDLPEKDWSQVGLGFQRNSEKNRQERVQKRMNLRQMDTQPSVERTVLDGSYVDDLYGTIRISVIGENIKMEFPHAPALSATLSHWHYDTYKINWDQEHAWFDFGTVQFVTDNNAQVISLRFDVPNDDIFFEEVHAQKVE